MISFFTFLKRTYNIIYAIEYKYFEKSWRKNFPTANEIIPFNVTLAMTLSFSCLFYGLILLLDFIIGKHFFLLFFSNRIFIYVFVGLVLIMHYYCYEYKSNYKKVITWFESLNISRSWYIFYLVLTICFSIGSIISFITLAIISVGM